VDQLQLALQGDRGTGHSVMWQNKAARRQV
jgi:hypothetical protein